MYDKQANGSLLEDQMAPQRGSGEPVLIACKA